MNGVGVECGKHNSENQQQQQTKKENRMKATRIIWPGERVDRYLAILLVSKSTLQASGIRDAHVFGSRDARNLFDSH